MRRAMKIRTLIVDDETLARERVKRLLRDEKDIAIIGECDNGKDAVKLITAELPDLVFLDIQMPEKNGFEVIRSLDVKAMPVIIFVTAYDQYALQAFDVHALDYLLKPIDRSRIHRAVNRAREILEHKSLGKIDERLASLIAGLKTDRKYLERLVVKTSGRIFFLKVNEIDWIEAAGNYVKLHTANGAHMIRDTMNGLSSKLDPQKFLRIHRSAVVNIDGIKELYPMFSGDYMVKMRDGTELTLSRNYRESFLEHFDDVD